MVDLGTLGGTGSFGRAINDSGQVTGNSATTEAATHAFLYTGTPGSGGHMDDLGALGDTSIGLGINAGGQVVGTSTFDASGAEHAFLYVGTPGAGGHMIDLDSWLDANNPTEGAQWTLKEAFGLNDTGLVAGWGTYDDGPGGLSDGIRAFLLDASALVVPEPTSFVLLGIGAALTVAIGRFLADGRVGRPMSPAPLISPANPRQTQFV